MDEKPTQTYELTEASSKALWRLSLDHQAGEMTLEPLDERESSSPLRYSRRQAHSEVLLLDGVFVKRTIEIQQTRKLLFSLDEEPFRAFVEWFGPPTRAQMIAELKSLSKFLLPIALLLVVFALPCPGTERVDVGLLPFNWPDLGLGLGLLVIYGLARFTPHRLVFLLDALWWLALALDTTLDVARARDHVAWLTLTAIAAAFAVGKLRQFSRFKRLAQEPSEPTER